MMSFYLDVNTLIKNWEETQEFCKKHSRISSINYKSPEQLKDKWYWIQCLCEAARFDDDNLDKLTLWLRDNIDSKAETDGELETFYSTAMEGRKRFPSEGVVIDSDEFRESLLLTLRRWLKKAQTLQFTKNHYITLLEALVKFASLAYLTKSPILVAPFSETDWEEWRQR